MPKLLRIPLPLLAAAAVGIAGVVAGPGSANAHGSSVTAFSGSPSHVVLNPQPLPPRWLDPISKVGLNPQPLPPRWLAP